MEEQQNDAGLATSNADTDRSSRLLVSQVGKEYPTPSDPLVVLRGVDLELSAGDNLAILGPSGCGKSTLLHIIGTLDTPTSGYVSLVASGHLI